MRPVRLDIRGFTAFREPQVVDFEGLDLFAITGPTGSGKSSILDAVTFALYGRAERVGDGVRQLVSQGQPRAAVVLEFEIGDERYRVARSVTADAKTKILLERADPTAEDGWRQAGEGADRVREADAAIERLVGLDYASFTRAVLLPQGRFAEFLAGDPKTRRKILADLLDLGLFERIAAKAGELARTIGAQVTGKAEILGSEFADATAATLEAARLDHRTAESLAQRFRAAREVVAAKVEQGAALDREVDEVRRIAGEATRTANAARGSGRTLRELAELVARAESGRATVAGAALEASAEEAAAVTALTEAEATWGEAPALAAAIQQARGLATERATVASRHAELAMLEERIGPLESAARAALEAAQAAARAEAAGVDAERAAGDALEAARRADRVAAISAVLAVGDPCPVCGRPLETLPDRHRAPELAGAEAALAAARVAAAETTARCRAAERTAADATAAVDRERDRAAHVAATLREESERLAANEAELAVLFEGDLPPDPAAELDSRLSVVRAAAAALDARRSAAVAAAEAVRIADAAVAGARSGVAAERARLETLAVGDLAARAVAASGGRLAAPDIPSVEAARDAEPSALADAAEALAAAVDGIAAGLEAVAAARSDAGRALLEEAEAAVGQLVPSPGDLVGLARAVDAGHTAAIGAAAIAGNRITDLDGKIARRAELEAELDALRQRGARFKQLALELRQDRIVAFLQQEALTALATAGSVHLEELSSGRYRLEVVEDEFLVVDTWNGEERRSVKTLSGGESFLASLGLALALSEQVPSLAATARSRVTSLFLDEGFGTLDEETLQVVIEAVETLGGDDRMVGVITHVTELAERLPARIVIEKSPRGSRIVRG